MMLSSIFRGVNVSQKMGHRSSFRFVQGPLPLVRFYSDNESDGTNGSSEDASHPSGGGEDGSPATPHLSGGGENGSPATPNPSNGGTNESPDTPHPSAGGSVGRANVFKRSLVFRSATSYIKSLGSFFPHLSVENTVKVTKGFVPNTLISLNAQAIAYITGAPEVVAKWLITAGINKGVATVTGPTKTREDELKSEIEALQKRTVQMEREALEKEREYLIKEREFGEKAVQKERENLERERDFFLKEMRSKLETLELKMLKEESIKQDSGSGATAPPQCVELVGFDANHFFQHFKPTGCNFVVIPFRGDLELARGGS